MSKTSSVTAVFPMYWFALALKHLMQHALHSFKVCFGIGTQQPQVLFCSISFAIQSKDSGYGL